MPATPQEVAAQIRTARQLSPDAIKHDLKPCPFCGTRNLDAIEFEHPTINLVMYVIRCATVDCLASGPAMRHLDVAVNRWNFRPYYWRTATT